MEINQVNFFEGETPLKITKPIKLIELFAGYGSQSLALKYLGIPFEHHKICEWAIPSIQAYIDIHFADDNTDYSEGMSQEDLIDFFDKHKISSDYSNPLTREQLSRRKDLRTIYNNAKASNNLLSICNIKGGDLEIKETDKFTYIMTYSFPCQDLSLAGTRQGMAKGSGTRSGMLWEVERLLDEIKNEGSELPQILLLENVPDIIGTKNVKHFAEWVAKLEQLGYTSKWKLLNGKDYGVPQNRNRCFMISWLEKNKFYDFPKKIKLDRLLEDVLEDEVDEKYYIPSTKVKYIIEQCNEKNIDLSNITKKGISLSNKGSEINQTTDYAMTLMARDYKEFGNQAMNAILEKKDDTYSNREPRTTTIFNYPHGYNLGGIKEVEVFPTIRESSTAQGNTVILEKEDDT